MIPDLSTRPVWLARTYGALDIRWLEEAIAPVAEFGRRARAGESLYRPGDERAACGAIARVATARRIKSHILDALQRCIAQCPDPRAIIARACVDEILADVDFFELSRFLEAVDEVRKLALDPLLEEIGIPPTDDALRRLLGPGVTPARTFYLGDTFDEELALARVDAVRYRVVSDTARARLIERVAAYVGSEQIRDGEFILMRERIDGLLPPELRVVREAPTYLLCEVALDEEALRALTELTFAEGRVAELEERVRARLSAVVQESAPVIEAALEALGALDSFIARVRFAQTYETCVPEIVDQPSLRFEEARYLPLFVSLSEQGRAYVPISLDLAGIGVISGPNMGGKTAALRTCGFLAACVAFGVPVPARCARLSIFEEIAWIGSGTERESGPLLSAFGAEVVALRGFLERGATRALLLIDEFARTTTPREGRALLIGLLACLGERDACALAATHLERVAGEGIAQYAIAGVQGALSGGEQPLDLDAALERIASVMDYRILRVNEREMRSPCDAIVLAEVLGLDHGVVERARREV